jgi:exosome complex component RRP42
MAMEITNLSRDNFRKMFSDGKRFDGRKLTEFRDVEITETVSNKAEGSARVKLGKSEVVVGVKLAVGEPYADSQDKGNLTVSADLLPLASPRFEHGPPDFQGIELPRLVDRVIRGAEVIELEKLCIKEGEKVWTVYIDIYPINDDGNLIDLATIGAIVALKNAVVPELDENMKPDYDKKSKKKLPLREGIVPLSFSFFKLGDSVILDPTREEEEACESRITFGMSKLDKRHMINSCQKNGDIPLTHKEIEHMMSIISDRYDEVMTKLKKHV